MNIICKAFSRSGRFLAGALALAILLTGCIPASNPVQTTAPTTTAAPTTIPTETSLPPETTAATTVPETTAETTVPTEPEPQPIEYILSFAGDCTLGTDYEVYGGQGTFVYQVGDNYGYPFEKTLPYFENDDFTMVNLEGVFTEYNVPAEKTYRFRAPPAYAKILTAGSVDVVNIANNHSRDFGQTGYDDTKAALEAENIVYVEDESTATFTTESGLKIGIFAVQFYTTYSHMENCIKQLRADGAEIVIVSFHWGIEGEYIHDPDQTAYAHAAIDYGADIVYGHHPHVLQPIEVYKNGVIYYSLGNFSFGGNRNPYDKDTVVIQQTVIRDVDGSIRLGETNPIPFRLSSVTERNDYQPVPYEEGSDAWKRTMAKLNGTYITKEPEQTTAPTETTAPEETTAPTETTVPEETTAPVETTVPEETTVPAETTAPEETTALVDYPMNDTGISGLPCRVIAEI